jgi:hypothetical protein
LTTPADQSYKWILNLQGSPSSRQVMKNIYEVLRQKEADIERLKKELQALRVVAPLLEEELTPELQVAPPPVRTYPTSPAKPATVAMATDTKPIWP